MSDEQNRRAEARLQQELDEFHADPVRLAQAQIDSWFSNHVNARAAVRRRIERPGAVDPESGIYDPMRRFENEP